MRRVIVDIVRAEGAPGPTLVLERERLPAGALAARAELDRVRAWLLRTGRGSITKLGLHGTSAGPDHQLDYRFVQAVPGGFDFRAACGHSLLACVVSAGLPGPVRVRALTTGDTVVCEPEPGGSYTVRMVRTTPVDALLPTRSPVLRLCGIPVTVVRFGNPYVFVDGRDLGLPSREQLFGAGAQVLRRLLDLRAAAARRLGHAPWSALPKIAVIGPHTEGRLSVRAVTVTGWHPGLAVTGAFSLASATAIEGTLPHRMTASGGRAPDPLRIDTPGGPVTASVQLGEDGRLLHSAAVHHKRAAVVERGVALPWRIHVTA